MSGSFNPVHCRHVEIMTAARNHLIKEAYDVVGGFIAMNSVDRLIDVRMVDEDRRYEILAMACKLADGVVCAYSA